MTANPPPVDWAKYAACPQCPALSGDPCEWAGFALNAPHVFRDATAQPSLWAPTEEKP